MRIVGIIAEYNPFHNGHQYHIARARELTDADYVVAVMSGDFVQRGAPAVYSKYLRAKAALTGGADLVLEMPVFGSVAGAEDFAICGVSLLAHTGIVTHLCFGSETGDLERLKQTALLYDQETESVKIKIKEGLKSGLTWPEARAQAFENSFSSPNDILGCEYIRAINHLGIQMEPVAVRRTDPGYHSESRTGAFASATAARKAILRKDMDFLEEVLPEAFLLSLSEECEPPVFADDFSMVLSDRLLSSSLEEICSIAGMPEDLAGKLFKNRFQFRNVSELTAYSKDRHYTYTRVSRCLTNMLLTITKTEARTFKDMESAPWLRILGFRRQAAPLLSELKKNASVPIITKTANAARVLSPLSYQLFCRHVLAADRYRMAAEIKAGRSIKNEYTRSVIIL